MYWTFFHWAVFLISVTVLLGLDLFIFHKSEKVQSFKESLLWTLFWCSCSLIFNLFVYFSSDADHAITYLTGYLVEWSLSIDNVFVFAVIFSYFQIPEEYQYRTLFWGIIGAMVIRMLFIFIGIGLVSKFSWMMLVFGVFLIYTGIKMLRSSENEDPESNPVLKIARKFLPVYSGPTHHFFVKENNKFYISKLFLVLLVIESSDVMFAVDSIPAIIGISSDRFIVYTSNVFAILGLRSLYFLLSRLIANFSLLKYGLCGVLCFIGIKMGYEFILDRPLVSPLGSLIVILILISSCVLASIWIAKRRKPNK